MKEWILLTLSLAAAIVLVAVAIRLIARFRKAVVVPETQSVLHLHNGVIKRELAAGRHVFWGCGHDVVPFDRRAQALTVQSQEILSADGISVKVTAVGLYRVVDAKKAFAGSTDPVAQVYTAVQLALRDLVGGAEIETLLKEKAEFGPRLVQVAQAAGAQVGLEVNTLAVRDLILPGEVKRAFSEPLRARKESLAKLEEARGEVAALRALANATRNFDNNPTLLQLRYLETLEKTAATPGNTFVVGLGDGVSVGTPAKLF